MITIGEIADAYIKGLTVDVLAKLYEVDVDALYNALAKYTIAMQKIDETPLSDMITEQPLIKVTVDTTEMEHHIRESEKSLEQVRFTIQEIMEKLSFTTSDIWLVLERLDSIKKEKTN